MLASDLLAVQVCRACGMAFGRELIAFMASFDVSPGSRRVGVSISYIVIP